MLEQQQPLTEILLIVALEDHLLFSIELTQQVQKQLFRMLESAEFRLPTQHQLLLSLPFQTGPDVSHRLIAITA